MKKERKNLLTVARINIESLFGKLFGIDPNGAQPKSEATPLVFPKNKNSIEIVHVESVVYENVIEFWFKPSVNIRLTKVSVFVSGVRDEIKGDLKIEYDKDNWYLLAGYENIRSAKEWMFSFNGEIADENRPFVIKTNYHL